MDEIAHESTPSSMEAMTHDSMVTVRLSGPPSLTVDTSAPPKPSGLRRRSMGDGGSYVDTASLKGIRHLRSSAADALNHNTTESPSGSESPVSPKELRRGSSSSQSDGTEDVDWDELEKTEEQEPRNEISDDSTALLLARLEQENNLLATNPKSATNNSAAESSSPRSQPRPPSMQQLKRMVSRPSPSALRYSVTPPPPMTDLEFYAALVRDYTRTAQRLPTLLAKKVRSGVPPPLRGVVWQSMSGARDQALEDEFDRLCGETSPYEGIIGKDLGRSFPGVEMFRDPEGDGQQMLGRVLKCFSLYDTKIGYCQGLGFLVGPLLMHMGDKQAFCVLVRLMERYDLRECFVPDLSGLHVRIHQFRLLLKQHLPDLTAHLESLQIEPAYVSQWFLSFFAVTCPLPMLFRIYDVIFAEGASETIMRVALSLMRKNEVKLMACKEFEDAMQLLLSRGLWDCYNYNADELVTDFVEMTGVVTHEILEALQASYRESQALEEAVPSDIGSAAARFLGRLWAGKSSDKAASTTSLTPAPTFRPNTFMKRTPSKQSLASTLNSLEADSLLSAGTEISRHSTNTDISSSIRLPSTSFKPNKDKNLHSQIEDLLTALSELQREHAVLATQLQQEREERDDDQRAVRSLIEALRKREDGLEASQATDLVQDSSASANHLASLLDTVETRFECAPDSQRSSAARTKAQLRSSLTNSKDALVASNHRIQELNRRVTEQEQQLRTAREEVREGHTQIRNAHAEKMRLEKTIHDMRLRKAVTTPDGMRGDDEWLKSSPSSGLRELKLGRQNSGGTQPKPILAFGKRTSSLAVGPALDESTPPMSREASPTGQEDHGALVLELVQSKTAEAVARQEAEEAKAKLEAMRKLLAGGSVNVDGLVNGMSTKESRKGHEPTPSQNSAMGLGIAGGISGALANGFWGGWGKRSVSTASD